MDAAVGILCMWKRYIRFNESYHTNASILLIKLIVCGNFHWQKLLNSNRFHTKSSPPEDREPTAETSPTVQEQLLRSIEKQFQGGLVFGARRLVYHSTLGRE